MKIAYVIEIDCNSPLFFCEFQARASMIWIIGEYAERIDNADELLESFLDSFQDENTQVQLQLLTAIVKLFLKHPTDTQELVQQVLSLATQDSDNPDLRDRGTYDLSFYRSQNVLGWSKFFVLDQKFIYILWRSQKFCIQ